jgi:hypothetical protein
MVDLKFTAGQQDGAGDAGGVNRVAVIRGLASASRNEPGPLSLVFVTTMILAGNALPTRTNALLALSCLATLCLVAFSCASAKGSRKQPIAGPDKMRLEEDALEQDEWFVFSLN